MSAWETLNLHPLLQRNLALAGFKTPTPIQAAALPPSMLNRKDVIGTAETGSGKTLAYALPIVQRLLVARARKGLGICKADAPFAELVREHDAQYGGGNMNTLAGAIGDAAEFQGVLGGLKKSAGDKGGDTATDEQDAEAPAPDGKRDVITEHPRFWDGLPALVLCPTRELALQVRDHIARLVAGTFVKCVAIVGGLSQAKHARMLRQRPDIIVATPGRFWDMVRSGKHAHLGALKASLRFLVLDEADRLVEPGHFSDLAELLHSIHPDTKVTHTSDEVLGGESDDDVTLPSTAATTTHDANKHVPVSFGGRMERQTFLFSATLAAAGKGVQGAAAAQRSAMAAAAAGAAGSMGKHEKAALQRELALMSPLEILQHRVGMRRRPAIVSIERALKRSADNLSKENVAQTAAALSSAAMSAEQDAQTADAAKAGIGGADGSAAEAATLGTASDGSDSASGSGSGDASSEEDDDVLRWGDVTAGEEQAEAGDDTIVALPSGLRLAKVVCPETDKNEMLYTFLQLHPGRTVVFVNAIFILKRVTSLLQLLGVPVFPLHANMQQKTRLKRVNAFAAASRGVLVATDVAARGLDVKGISYVVHYHLPSDPEAFIHRSGRAARAGQQGLAVALVSPKDTKAYQKALSSIGRPEGLPSLPVDPRYHKQVVARLSVAGRIQSSMEAADRRSADKKWLMNATERSGLEADDDVLADVGLEFAPSDDDEVLTTGNAGHSSVKSVSRTQVRTKKQLRKERAWRNELAQLLRIPLVPTGTSHRYLTNAVAGAALGVGRHAGVASNPVTELMKGAHSTRAARAAQLGGTVQGEVQSALLSAHDVNAAAAAATLGGGPSWADSSEDEVESDLDSEDEASDLEVEDAAVSGAPAHLAALFGVPAAKAVTPSKNKTPSKSKSGKSPARASSKKRARKS